MRRTAPALRKISPRTRMLLVNRGSGTVTVIDTITSGLLHTADIGRDLGSISVNPDGRTAYVTAGNSDLLFTVTL